MSLNSSEINPICNQDQIFKTASPNVMYRSELFFKKNPHLQSVYNPHSSRCVLHVFVIQQKKGQPRLVITIALSNLRNLGSFLNNTLES